MRSESLKSFLTAVNYLPDRLWAAAFSLDLDQREKCEEIRLRKGRHPKALVCGKYITLTYKSEALNVTTDDILVAIQRATKASVYSCTEQLSNGFITTSEGHRIGVAGEIVAEGNRIITIKNISSLNLRIAKPYTGFADKLVKDTYKNGFMNTVIVSEAGAGKTTLLRDMARALSKSYAVSVADERFEIAGSRGEKSGFDIGDCDVISGGQKRLVLENILRSMSPDIIALDEISSENDIEVIKKMAYCGAGFLLTTHGGEIGDLQRRIVYRPLLTDGIFDVIIKIENREGNRLYRVYTAEEDVNAEDRGNDFNNTVKLGSRVFRQQMLFASHEGDKEYN